LASAGVVDDLIILFGLAAVVLVSVLPFRDYDDGALLRAPWSGQRADQPAGVTVTAAQRPHVAQ
ncbi:MAG TPA: hypothetical protein VHX40_03050, partial [Acidimicrobiales bacterium]|nr:hypothetical protein [Acidimicrobiales bacterium]